MSTALIFADVKNRFRKHDGDEFRRESKKCMNVMLSNGHNIDYTSIDSTIFKRQKATKRREIILDAIARKKNVTHIAMFCHGWPNGISLGFSTAHIPELARTIAASCESNVVHIGLYACLTGRGQFWWWKKKKYKSLFDRPKNLEDRKEKIVTKREGFAMLLCSELRKLGVRAYITAHLTAGHTTRNPHKVRIYSSAGDTYRVKMKGKIPYHMSGSEWTNRLKDMDDMFRFELMDVH